ncbi:MAG: 7-carboxy-7-deazaguanine synthase QueE [Dehalobacterium sp.]
METWVQEVFSSIQGEGIYVGVRQIFLRFIGCNLKCAYCDSHETQSRKNQMFRVETEPGQGKFAYYKNPVSPEKLLEIIMSFKPGKHHSLSLTGGEPLLQADFLQEFLPLFHRLCPVFLETNGTLPDHLVKVLPYIDIISMDIKLPSVTGCELWQQHENFLRCSLGKDVYVKIVLTGATTQEELDQIIRLLKKIDISLPLVLQPVTPLGGVKEMAGEKLIGVQDYLSSVLKNVRVIPQTHIVLNQL